MAELTKEQIEEIKNYGDSIESLESFVEAVRKLPGMYIGHKGNKGYMNMFREILQNSMDEIAKPTSPCNMIKITFDEKTCTAIIEDNGRGIPFDNIIRIFANQHTSSNYTKRKGEYSSGMHGAGSKITNALSSKFIVESYILGDARRVEFTDGVPWKKGEVKIPNKENRQGTIITFVPSFEVMGNITTTANDILELLQLLNPLTPIGTKFYYNAIFADGKSKKITIENKDGIMTFMYDACKKPIAKPILFGIDTGEYRANVAICYDFPEESTVEIIIPFCNMCPTDTVRSSHVKGCITGLKKYFISYMNRVYLNTLQSNGKKKKKNISINESDVRTGLRLVIDAACLEPLFTGQAKEVLSVDGMEIFMEQFVFNSLTEWGKTNPQDLQKICKYLKDMAETRMDSDTKRVKLSNQYASSSSGLPSKYMRPTKQRKELFIVEGDSAGGSFDTYRDNDTQGVFPIRGMILNCFEKPEKTCLENAEVAGIIAIIGGGYGKNFNIDKVVWEKIICCFTGDTRVRTLNSATDYMTFEELTEYCKNNPDEQIWVYSYDINTGKYKPAIATNIGIREYTKQMAIVTLDDGGTIKCTTDHKFLTRDRGYIEAKDLISGESLVPLYTRTNKNGREEIYDGKWTPTFHWSLQNTNMIIYNQGYGMDIHHKDEDKTNDSPDNLEYKDHNEHILYHAKRFVEQYNGSEAQKEMLRQKHAEGVYGDTGIQNIISNTNYDSLTDYNRSEEHKQIIRDKHARGEYKDTMDALREGFIRHAQTQEYKDRMITMNNDPVVKQHQAQGKLAKYGKMLLMDGYFLNPEYLFHPCVVESIRQRYGKAYGYDTIIAAFGTYENFLNAVTVYEVSEEEHLAAQKGPRSVELNKTVNNNRCKNQIAKVLKQAMANGIDPMSITEEQYTDIKMQVATRCPVYKNILEYFNSMEEAIEYAKYYNHKVVSVEIVDLEEPVPMYCMTVSGYENFAVCSSDLGCAIVHNCSDADGAGKEINALLLRLVLRFMPQLIHAGKFYKAIPPRYYIGKGKQKLYFADRMQLIDYVQKSFSKFNKITTLKDKQLSASGVQELLYKNYDYIYELERIANRYRIKPDILEVYLYNRDKSPKEICKIIKSKYRFMEQMTINGHIVCEGIADGQSNTLILDGRLLNDCKEIIKIMEGNLYDLYKLNGQVCTILDIMKAYTSYQPSSITMLKGLGEQSGPELAESVILPGDKGNRTLLQYTMSSAMEEIDQIRKYESDKSKLLEGLIVNRIDVVD